MTDHPGPHPATHLDFTNRRGGQIIDVSMPTSSPAADAVDWGEIEAHLLRVVRLRQPSELHLGAGIDLQSLPDRGEELERALAAVGGILVLDR